MVTTSRSSTRKHHALLTLKEAVAAAFDHAEAEGATILEATTAAHESVSLAVTGYEQEATTSLKGAPDFPAIPDLTSDDDHLLN